MTTNNATNTSNPIALAQGGTGATSQSGALTAILGSSAVPIANGGTGQTSQGAALTALLGSSSVGVANGGTGATTLTSHGLLIGNGTSAITASAELADGQLLVGSTGNPPVATTITQGTGISVTNAAGSITIAATGAGFTWNAVSGTSATLVANNAYVSNNSALTTYLLPATATLGDRFSVFSSGANTGFSKVTQNTGQKIRLGSSVTTTGTGSLTGTAIGDVLNLVCVDGTGGAEVFQVQDSVGNFTVV